MRNYIEKGKFIYTHLPYITDYFPEPRINMQEIIPHNCDHLHLRLMNIIAYSIIGRQHPTKASRPTRPLTPKRNWAAEYIITQWSRCTERSAMARLHFEVHPLALPSNMKETLFESMRKELAFSSSLRVVVSIDGCASICSTSSKQHFIGMEG